MNVSNLKLVLSLFKNKYVLAILAFLVWMTFFDDKSIGFMYNNAMKLKELKKSEINMAKSIEDTKAELKLLTSNAKSVEKYAREKFYMKKENEELFITEMK
jgi:cell division protein DivIC